MVEFNEKNGVLTKCISFEADTKVNELQIEIEEGTSEFGDKLHYTLSREQAEKLVEYLSTWLHNSDNQ